MIFCLHKWNKWSELVDAYNGMYQFKVCSKCGSIRKRYLGYAGEIRAFESNEAIEKTRKD